MTTVMDGMTARSAMTAEVETTAEAETTEEVILSCKSKIGIVQNVLTLTFHSELNVIAVARKKVEEVLAINVMTAEAETTDVAVGMTVEAEMTVEVIPIIKIKTGIVQNVVIPTLHSELNVIAVAKRKVVEDLATNATTAGAETTDVAAEMTVVAVGMTGEVEMTEEVIPIIKIKIGIVQNVVIPTLHSELNVIAVVRKRAEELALNAMIAEAEMTDVDEMTEVAVEKTEAGIIDVEETRAKIIVAPIQIMIGNVKSVTTQISHSGRNAIAVVNPKVGRVKNHLPGGKEMTEDPVHEKRKRNRGPEIGIVLNVVNLISQSETTASVVAVQSA